jgi:tetratricopeptide (TPR) repeat protein
MQLPGDRFNFSMRPDVVEKRKKQRRVLALVLFGTLALTLFLLIVTGKLPFFHSSSKNTDNRETVEEKTLAELWEERDYLTINERCEKILELDPLSEEHLLYNGFAYFYRGSNQYTPEDQFPLFDKAVINLRKLLIFDNPPEQGKIHYVLGKTYFHKGRFYLDLAVLHLRRSVELGYAASDTLRYLGLSLGEMGRYEESIEIFLKAAENSPDAILYMTIGQTYYKMGRNDKALEFLNRSVQTTDRGAVEQRARFLLGKIYMDMDQIEKARDQFEVILSKDPRSADAHYHLGEIYELKGDNVKARAAWRKTLNIEPSHYGALLKLY